MEILNSIVLTDNVIGKPYQLATFNARELSEFLKKQYQDMGIDLSEFNKLSDRDKAVDINEIYEYNQFSLISENMGEKYFLLDGFRRLLFFDVPDMTINVRIYNREELTDNEILTLMIYFNQYKVVGTSGGKYFERGFALMLFCLYGINIMKFEKAFRGYMEQVNKLSTYYGDNSDNVSSDEVLSRMKHRILNTNFLNDMEFLNGFSLPMRDSYALGMILFEIRSNNYDGELDYTRFEKDVFDNTGYSPCVDTIAKFKDNRGDKAKIELINIYKGCLLLQFGVEPVKTYSEYLVITKAITEQFKKDKNYVKISGVNDYHHTNLFLKDFQGPDLDIKVIVHPDEGDKTFEIMGLVDGVIGPESENDNMSIRGPRDVWNIKCKFGELGMSGYESYSGYTKQYTYLKHKRNKTEVWVKYKDLSKGKLKELIKSHYNKTWGR